LTTAKAAEALGVPRQQLHKVLTCQSATSPEMAVRLEAVIGSTSDHWMKLQTAYDLAKLRLKKAVLTKGLRRLTPAT
jgi:addiction module HigA family antidote